MSDKSQNNNTQNSRDSLPDSNSDKKRSVSSSRFVSSTIPYNNRNRPRSVGGEQGTGRMVSPGGNKPNDRGTDGDNTNTRENQNDRSVARESRDFNHHQQSIAQKAQNMKTRAQQGVQNRIQGGKQQLSPQALKQRANNMKSRMKDSMKAKLSRQSHKGEFDAVSVTLILVVFMLSILADLLGAFNLTVILSVVVSAINMILGLFIALFWWFLGAGNDSIAKKQLRRVLYTYIIEAIPLINVLPVFTVMSIINLLDYMGAFNKIEAVSNLVKK